ncbi:DUF4386 domain-containing protein [Serinicoccus kebangsaanensis]|uniref:DUF4386 domain-containing protein n=1 Tax=Serinicoccus kebangsaanensis TaxID=2602069 RepID=UPI00124F37F0|nr:DUF4386 domain-containing protein [Serinicoccus kebangsaanensis]
MTLSRSTTASDATAAVDQRPPGRRAAVVTGAALLLMALVAIPANLVVQSALTGEAPAVAQALTAQEAALRLGVLGLLTVAVLDVVVAWGLGRVLATPAPGLATLVVTLRLVYVAVFVVAIALLLVAVETASSSTGDAPAAVLAASAFSACWRLGLVVFATHLAVLAAAFVGAPQLPTWLGLLLGLGATAYAVDGVVRTALGADAALATGLVPVVSACAAVGELVLAGWLLTRGGRR